MLPSMTTPGSSRSLGDADPCVIGQEEAAPGTKRVVDVLPEAVGQVQGDVREPEGKKDCVVDLVWLPCEEVADEEVDVCVACGPKLRRRTRSHLRCGVYPGDARRHRGEPERPLARAVGELQDLAGGREPIEGVLHLLELAAPLRVLFLTPVVEALSTEPLVVLGSAGTVVGKLLSEHWAVRCHGLSMPDWGDCSALHEP